MFHAPFLVGCYRSSYVFFDLAVLCGRLQGTDVFNHHFVVLLVYNLIWVLTRHSIIRAIERLFASHGTLCFDLLQQKPIFGTQPASNIVGSLIHHHRWLLLKKNEIVALCFLCLFLRDWPPCLFCLSLVLGSSYSESGLLGAIGSS